MLEQDLQALTAAVDRLTAALINAASNQVVPGKPQLSGTVQGTRLDQPGTTSTASTTPTTSPSESPGKSTPSSGSTKTSVGAAPAPNASGGSPGATLDYEKDVFPLAAKLIANGKKAEVVAVMKQLAPAATKLSGLPPETFAEAIAKFKALLGD